VQDGGPGRMSDELQRLVDVVVQDGGPGQTNDELQRLIVVVVQDGKPASCRHCAWIWRAWL
jgi:hypothetical protein